MNARAEFAMSFAAWVQGSQASVEAFLERTLPPADRTPARLHQAMRYSVLGGGKRVRPLLACAAGEAAGAPPDRVIAAAAAVELIHCYSLIHDDLPCMDDDVLRRGRATTHVQFDEATAMLAGDALQCLAFEAVPDGAAAHGEMVRLLARASGSQGMAGGQAIDLESVGATLSMPQLEHMHRMKTGALIEASVLMGALCAPGLSSSERTALEGYAAAMGLAFQIVDDILDAAASTETLGKTAGKDAARNKPTYVAALGLDGAKARAAQLRDQARRSLAPLGEPAQRLRELADFIILRSS